MLFNHFATETFVLRKFLIQNFFLILEMYTILVKRESTFHVCKMDLNIFYLFNKFNT
jgi:hypothetical protein